MFWKREKKDNVDTTGNLPTVGLLKKLLSVELYSLQSVQTFLNFQESSCNCYYANTHFNRKADLQLGHRTLNLNRVKVQWLGSHFDRWWISLSLMLFDFESLGTRHNRWFISQDKYSIKTTYLAHPVQLKLQEFSYLGIRELSNAICCTLYPAGTL